jgi:hypothetical protein
VRRSACVVGLVVLLAAPAAFADAGDKAMAEALFRAAKDLQAHGHNADACPKYAESHRLDPKPGTILNLAACHEADGKIASAWADYSEAATIASRSKQGDREKFAKTKMAELEKKLPYVTFEFASGYEIVVDGKALSTASVGTRVPIDAGEHAIEAHAPGRLSWTSTFTIDAGPSDKTITVPELVEEHVPPPPPAPIAEPPPRAEAASSGSTQRTLGWIVAGVGVAGLGVGGFFGARTLSEKSTVDQHCAGAFCDDDGLSANDRAKSSATISTISIIAGSALVVGGIVLVLTARQGPTPSTAALR